MSTAISVAPPVTTMVTVPITVTVPVPVAATAWLATIWPASLEHHGRAVPVLTVVMGMRAYGQSGAEGGGQDTGSACGHRRDGQHLANIAGLLR
ncbi:hypothetical protein UI24_01795 [Mycobacteroides franklinii]|nr:hypothetical protein [Mycobacteroides franklinii]